MSLDYDPYFNNKNIMSDSNSSSQGGVGLLGLTFLVFLVLKFTGFIAWSWWWVTAPLWGGFALLGIGILIYLGIIVLAELIDDYQRKNRNKRFEEKRKREQENRIG